MLIGVCGAAGSGKGTLAASLVRRHGFSEIAFADPIYAAVSAMTEIPVCALKDRSLKERPIEWLGRSPRELLQILGTEFGRKMISDSIWVEAGMRRISRLRRYGESVVVADVRFQNEANAIRTAGGVIWMVTREHHESCLSGAAATHESESGISPDLVDAVVANNGTFLELEAQVDAALLDATRLYNESRARQGCAHDRPDKAVHY